MKVLGLMPVRNESWILEHSLASLSGFCDAILVADQQSDDDSREICRRFPKVTVVESPVVGVCEQARWQLVDAARQYDGRNLWWWNDADELVSPSLAASRLPRDLAAGDIVECLFYHLWGDTAHYRDDFTLYRPHRKAIAIVDDRKADYDRSDPLPLHQPRVAVMDERAVAFVPDLPVLHLQWLVARRNQMKQAWYRCREWLAGGKTAAEINARYSVTFVPPRVRTAVVPEGWTAGLTFPDLTSADSGLSWHEREIRAWLIERGPAFFEPLEIWHIRAFHDEFRRSVGRRPRPDRSYRPPLRMRARHLARRAVNAGVGRVRAVLR